MFNPCLSAHAKDKKKSFNAYASSNAHNYNKSLQVRTDQGDFAPSPIHLTNVFAVYFAKRSPYRT